MTLTDLIATFRRDVKDTVTPYIWRDLDVIAWLNEAEDEACIRARLLFDRTTSAYCDIAVLAGTTEYALDEHVTEVVAATLEDAGGEVYPLEILTREWLGRHSAAWRSADARMPTAIMHQDQKVEFNAEPDAAYTLQMEIYRKPAVGLFARHPVAFASAGDTVTHTAHGHVDGEAVMFATVNLTTGVQAETVYYIRDALTDTYKVALAPGGAAISLAVDGNGQAVYLDATPEVGAPHHIYLVKWAMYKAFGVPETDGFDQGRSDKALRDFEDYFGPRPNSDLRKLRNADRVVWSRFGHGVS